MSSKVTSLPRSIERIISSLTMSLVPPSDDIDLTGIEEHVLMGCQRVIGELPPMTRWALFWGLRVFEW